MLSACLAFALYRLLCQDDKPLNSQRYRRPRSRSHHGHGAKWELCSDLPSFFLPVLCISILGAWIGPVVIAWLGALPSKPADHIDEMLVHLAEPKMVYLAPQTLRFSTRRLLSRTRDRTPIHQIKKGYAVRATFHEGLLFALDNYTLFSAQYNKIDEILVYIVKKPSKFSALFQHDQWPFHAYFEVDIVYEESPDLARLQLTPEVHKPLGFNARPCAMRIPADAFPTAQEDQPAQWERQRELSGSVVLVADRVVKHREKLADLIRNRHPNLGVQDPPGDLPRSYACFRVPLKHEAVAREAIKALGKERGKSSINIKALPETLVFDSPRD